jgi:hypothetical protein
VVYLDDKGVSQFDTLHSLLPIRRRSPVPSTC